MNSAKAALFAGINQPFQIKEYPVTKPSGNLVELSLEASGICGTDIHILSGRLGSTPNRIIGHEFVGRVVDTGSANTDLKPGDCVISDIACPCGECLLCRTGDDANCVNMAVTNGGDPEIAPHFFGGYGELSYAPAENLIKVPESISPDTAAVYACAGPTSLHAFRLAAEAGWKAEDTKTAVVQGTGPVGTFAIMYLKSLGIPNVIALTGETNEERNKHTLDLGADLILNVIDMSDEEISAKIQEISGGLGADLVFEGSGAANAVPTGISLLRNRGFYLIPGQYSDRGNIPIPTHMITFKALRLIGSSQYSVSDVETYIEFLEANPELHSVIDSVAVKYPISEVNTAIDDLKNRKVIKALLVK